MSGILWIGPPWEDDHAAGRWMHSYIWTVPGDDPYGPPGLPKARGDNYVWATVSNTHDTDAAVGATVEFYLCHYGTAPQRSARLLGTSRVDIAPRTSEDVLCVVPLREHRDACLQVVVRHRLDALPADWTPMADRYWNKHTQVGYLNLKITTAPADEITARAFEIAVPGADTTRVAVTLSEEFPGGADRDRLFGRTGLDAALPYEPNLAIYGLSLTPNPETGWEGVTNLSLDIPHDESRIGYIITRTAQGPVGFMGLSAVAQADGRVQGGVSVIVVRTAE